MCMNRPDTSPCASAHPFRSLDLGKFFISFYRGDVLDMLGKFNRGCADVIVTSPPYNIGTKYRSYSDTLPRSRYIEWMENVSLALRDVLSDGGSFFLNMGCRPRDQLLPMEIALSIGKHYRLQNTIHWIKSVTVEKFDSSGTLISIDTTGHVKPVSSSRYLYDQHEYIFHFTKKGDVKLDKQSIGVPFKDKSNIRRWKGNQRDIRDRGNVWYIPYETIQNSRQRPHPATFPRRLPEFCIRLHGLEKTELVLDPFNGIGNSALACASLQKSFAGIDMDSHYLEYSFNRVLSLLRKDRSVQDTAQ